MPSSELELIADYKCAVGEGCIWHPDEGRVYWLDCPKGRVFSYDPSTGEHGPVREGNPVGGLTIQADGSLLLFGARGSVHLWRSGAETAIIEEISDERETTFNDVAADPEGRVFCGTLPTRGRLGRLYRLDPDGSLTVLLEGIGCSNGIGFMPDLKGMYYTDSDKREIYLFDYDRESGAISNQRVLVQGPEEDGLPDGMTVDAAGYLWSAHWDGSCALRYAPDGTEDMRLPFPTKKVSCVTFGGLNYTDIYFTTAGGDNKAENGEAAGALFRIDVGIRGLPEFRSQIRL